MRRKKDQDNQLFYKMNKYYKNTKLTIEIDLSKFLDKSMDRKEDGHYNTEVYWKKTKLLIHWLSKVPKGYKRNSIREDLHHFTKIATDFQKEVTSVRKKFLKADYPIKFINRLINNFFHETESTEDSYIIQLNLFKEEKRIVIDEIPYCEENENKSRFSQNILQRSR